MDRSLYISMSGARETMIAQSVTANNLANASTVGFKADLVQARAMPVFGDGLPSRAYAMSERPATDFAPGMQNATGRELDIAVHGEGWIAVQAPDGAEAYTRAGDLRISANGLLTTGAGHPVLGDDGGPIAIPPSEKIEIGADGTISVRPVGQDPNVLAEVNRIKLVNPALADLTKGGDGLLRLKEGGDAPPDANVQLASGVLENSNVNTVGALVDMIALARRFELQIKAMKTAEENDEVAAQMMKMA